MRSCRKFKSLINLYLDSEISSKQERILLLHIGNCSECQGRLEEVKNLHKTIKSLSILKTPEGFHNQIMSSLYNKSIRNHRLTVLRPIISFTGVVAAIISITIIGWYIYAPEPTNLTPEIYIVSPLKEAVIDQQYVDISAAFNDVDSGNIRLILDSKDVTEATEINEDFLIYTSEALQDGHHMATIQVLDNKGAPIAQHSWAFYVIQSASI